jgi:MFS superfamily sulfate permease-like transporter
MRKRKKQLSVKRKKKKKKAAKRKPFNQQAREVIEKRLNEQRLFGNTKIVFQENINKEKMSEVLLDFAQPLLDHCGDDDDEAFRNMLAFAVCSWNMALVPRRTRDKMWTDTINTICGFDLERRKFAEYHLTLLEKRKNELYPDNHRFIVDIEVRCDKNNRRVFVASTPVPDDVNGLLRREIGTAKKKTNIFHTIKAKILR